MKITHISSQTYVDANSIQVSISIEIPGADAATAITRVLALFNQSSEVASETLPKTGTVPAEKAEAAPTNGRRTRNRPAATAEEPKTDATAEEPKTEEPATEGRRVRKPATVEAEMPAEISDVEMSKACSNAAAILSIELVMAILEEYDGVRSGSDIPQAERQGFLNRLRTEAEKLDIETKRAL